LLLLLLPLQTVELLLPADVQGKDKLQSAAEQWAQVQGMSVRSAAAFARSCAL
jgi:hypothetical protein